MYILIMVDVELYKIFGYWDYYYEDMFLLMDMGDGEMLVLCLMNCLYYMMVYKNDIYSYCELLIWIVELGMMYCYEKFGVLLGL